VDQSYVNLRYALYLRTDAVLDVYELGVRKGSFGTYAVADLLKVEVTGGVVRYSRMAGGSGPWTLLYTSTLAPAYPLLLDTAIMTVGGQIQQAQFGAGTCP
jgi:hypothetical protein